MIQIPAAALVLLAVTAIAGCAQATAAPEVQVAPVNPTVNPTVDRPVDQTNEPAPGRRPVWPGLGCGSRSVVSIDYARMPTGHDSPIEAVEASAAPDLPDGVLTMSPDQGKGAAHVWILDPATDEIRADVSVYRGPDGWFVDAVMTCS